MKHQAAFRYAAVGAAVLIPTLVIAQQQQRNPPNDGTFAANALLRASDVEQLRDALADAIARLNTLQADSGGITKEDTYPITESSAPVAQNDVGLAQAFCDDANDILIACGCRGFENGFNSQQFNVKRITTTNVIGNISSCVCQAANVGSNVARVLEASGTCIRVP